MFAIQDGTSYTELMDITKDILDLIPETYEPGAALPNSDSIRSRLGFLDRQYVVVDTLLWVMENKNWLSECNFKLSFEGDYVYVKNDEIAWSRDTPEQLAEEREQKIQDIADDLGVAIYDLTGTTVENIVSAMNRIHWDPDKAFQALVPLVPTLSGGPSQEAWLGAHLAHFEATLIQESTPEASLTSPSRPRM